MGKFFAALAAALWAYDGWEDLNRVGSEVEEPQRNIPLALIGGTILVGGIYLLFSAVCFYALPFASVASSSHVASDVVASFRGARRGGVDYVGDGGCGARHAEFVATERGARALCDGARRAVFPRDGNRASEISYSGRGVGFSGHAWRD